MVKLSENALKVAESRYFMEGEDWDKCSLRVANAISINEKDQIKYRDKFYDMIYNMNFLPGGRILRNAGRLKGSLFNCIVLPIDDSIESIGQCKKEALQVWSKGSGIGINFSNLRPKGTDIKGIGGKSSGLVSFMKTFNYDASVIEIGGQRKAAAMGMVDISHPEVLDFIDAKLQDGDLSYFNISVAINNKFIEAVEEDKEWEFKFAQKLYGSMKARKIWDKIIDNMYNVGEPGIINFDNLRKNNSYWFAPVVSTNVCGESVLEAGGVCDLGSINLPSFIKGETYTNWEKMDQILRLSVRFLDNIIDIENYILEINKRAAYRSRKIGIGLMGFAEYLFAKKIKYGSEKAINEIDKLMTFIRNTVYDESVNLAIEKGSFPAFETSPFCHASFVRTLPAKLRLKIREHGIRNCTLLALAPTGSISLLPEITSGIEPLFSKAFIRKDMISERIYIHHLYKKFIETNELIPDWYVDSYDLQPEDHFVTQVAFQAKVDQGISKCIDSNTRISTNRGLIKIADISSNRIENKFEGINLEVLNSNTKTIASHYYYNGKRSDGIRITTKNGFSIEGTKQHKIKILNNDHQLQWKSLMDISINDIVVTKLRNNIFDSSKSRLISDLLEKQFFYEKNNHSKDINIPIKISRDLCLWLGFLFADGFITKTTGTIGLCQVGGKVLEKFIFLTKKLFEYDCKLIKDERRENLYTAKIHSKELTNWLINYLEFSKDRILELIFRGGNNHQKSFIEGVTLDGYITDTLICLKTDKSKEVIKDLQLLCGNIGIPTYILPSYNKIYNKDYYNLNVQMDGLTTLKSFVFPEEYKYNKLKERLGKSSIVLRKSYMYIQDRIPINTELLNILSNIESQCLYAPRLYNIFHSMNIEAKKYNSLTIDALLVFYTFLGKIPKVFDSNYLFSHVKNIEIVEIDSMDLEVPDGNEYIANGFISHNTILFPENAPKKDLDRLLLEYIKDCKGVTIYRDNCKKGQPLNKLKLSEVKKILKEEKEKIESSLTEEDINCKSGVCDL